MVFIEDTVEREIFNALISRETKFTIDCIDFTEKVIEGTLKEREQLCKKRAKMLAKLVAEC